MNGLSFGRRHCALSFTGFAAVGWLAESRAREKARQHHILQCQPAYQSDEYLRGACKLCAFGRDPDAPALTFALDEIYAARNRACAKGAGISHCRRPAPGLPFEYFLEMIRGLNQRCPGVHLKAFTMVEVGYFARIAKLSTKETLLKLKEAGVRSLPAEARRFFIRRAQDYLRSQGQRADVAQHRAAGARIGLHSNATMLYGT